MATPNANDATPEMINAEHEAAVTRSGLGNAIGRIKTIQVALEARTKKGDELVEYLKKKLENNLKAQLTDNLTIRRQSVREMKMLKEEIYRGNLSLTQKNRDAFYGLYNRAVQESVKSNSVLAQSASDFVQSVKGNLPSLDNVLSAVSVANPVVGFGLKLTKDLIASATGRKKAFEEERKITLKNLEEEAEKTEIEHEAAEAALENELAKRDDGASAAEAVREMDESTDRRSQAATQRNQQRHETQKEWLKRIYTVMAEVRENTDALIGKERMGIENADGYATASPNATRVDFDDLLKSQDVIHSDLERVDANTEKLVRIQEEAANRIEAERLQQIEASRESKADSILDAPKDEGGRGIGDMLSGFLLGKAGLLGKLAGILGMVLAPIGALFSGLLGLAKFIPGVALVTTAVMGAKAFFDGFSDAANILGKPENQVDFGDKVAAGIGSLAGMIGGVIDWLAGLLGFELNLKETITKSVAGLVDGYIDTVTSLYKGAFELLTGFFGNVTSTVDNIIDWAKDQAKSVLPDFMSGWLFGDESDADSKDSVKDEVVDATPKLKIAKASAMDEMTENSLRDRHSGPTVVSAPSNTMIDQSSNTTMSIPRTARNDDRTIDRLHRQVQ